MYNFNLEKYLFASGYKFIIGVDEAGRGSWAGPVVSAAVVFDLKLLRKHNKPIIADSKKLSSKKREIAFSQLLSFFSEINIGICDHEMIDKKNILQATLLSMAKAVDGLKKENAIVLVDGKNKITAIKNIQQTLIHGDDKIYCISAASIVAKVVRDAIMDAYHKEYPHYNFTQNKGYGTKEHFQLLQKNGVCPVHRKSYKPIAKLLKTCFLTENQL